MKTIFTVLWLLSNGDILNVQRGPEFDSMDECLAYKYQFDFLAKPPAEASGGFVSYCEHFIPTPPRFRG